MIRTRTALSLVMMSLVALFTLAACSKDSTPSFVGAQKEYKLYNQSSGSPVEAGTFTIIELQDGNAALNVNISTAYRVPGVTLSAKLLSSIVVGSELVYADLGNVDGTSGGASFNPVKVSATNLAVKYTDLIAKTGYVLRILNGANIQASGVIN